MKLITEVVEDILVEQKGKDLYIEGVFLQSNILYHFCFEY